MKNVGIHITDFNDNIIDYISKNDGALFNAQMSMNVEEKKETFDFTILSERAENMRERNRVIAQDNNGIFREFIITHVVDNFDGTTDIESNASYFEDINNAKPIKPGKYSAFSTSQALRETLANTGWELSDETEHGGLRTTSWTSYATPYDLIYQLGTTYSMVPDFYIELGSHTVEHRYVSLKQSNSLFKGKEITKGKDLTEMTRTTDMSEIKTALYAIGPEKDDGTRLEIIIKDDEAQQQFGLPGRYLWGIYEPESDDTEMTSSRLTTLAKTELKKLNRAAISYEIGSTDIHKHYEDIPVFLRDTVRIKDRDFKPALYIEAEVIGIEYDFINDESTFTFGNIKEYDESSLRESFNKRMDSIQKKVNDKFSNVNTIVRDVVAGELEFYERKIIKSIEPPTNPVNDTLWYDTSNPNVAVLRRYWNGEWLEETADDVEKIGGITREKALYSELTNTFTNLTISHAKLQSELFDILSSEYLVDEDLKSSLNTEYEKTTGIFNNIYENLNSMTPETATIGKLVDTQSLFLKYREQLQNLYKAIQNANVAINTRFKLLQSQYTDEKFNETLSKIADKFGFDVSPDGLLVGESSLVSGAIQALKDDTDEQFKNVVKTAQYEADQKNIINRLNTADSERIQLSNQIIDRVTLNEFSEFKNSPLNLLSNMIYENGTFNIATGAPSGVATTRVRTINYINITPGPYVIKVHNMPSNYNYDVCFYQYDGNGTFLRSSSFYSLKSSYKYIFSDDVGKVKILFKNNLNTIITTQEIINAAIKFEKGELPTNFGVNPTDNERRLNSYNTQIVQNGTDINARATKEEFNASKKTLSRVVSDLTINTTTGISLTYDENGAIQSHTVGPDGIKIRGDKVDIVVNKEFQVLAGNVDNKVGKGEIVNRLNLSPEGLDINVNNIGIRGGDNSNYVKISNDIIELSGTFTRTFRGDTQKDFVFTRMKDGLMRFRNNSRERSLYFSDFGISTYIDGDSNEASGTLQFFDYTYSSARGVTLNSANGVVALSSNANRIILDANATVNIESETSSIYFRPMRNSRIGLNEFRMWVKDNDSSKDTDGVLTYGSITTRSLYGSGIRFDKSKSTNYIYATNNNGDIGSGDFYGRKLFGDWEAKNDNLYALAEGKLRIIDKKGYNNGDVSYRDLQTRDIQANSIRVNTGTNLYLGTSTGSVRVTNNLLYNGGSPGYRPIVASSFNNPSLEEYKENILEWNFDALNAISEETQLYSFNYLSDENKETKYGLVIGEGYKTPYQLVDGDAIDLYAMITWAFRAIQQINTKLKRLERNEYNG